MMLRQVMARYIPASVSEGRKQGFSAPDASWFRGESIDYVRATLLSKKARIYDYFDYQAVTSTIDEHLSGKTNRRLLIWSLLNFETWLSIFSDGGWRALAAADMRAPS